MRIEKHEIVGILRRLELGQTIAAPKIRRIQQSIGIAGEDGVAKNQQGIQLQSIDADREVANAVDVAFQRGIEHEAVGTLPAGEFVVALTAVDDVVAGTAIERVGRVVAGKNIVETIAGELAAALADAKVFDFARVAEQVAAAEADQGVVTFAAEFGDDIGGLVDDVSVVAKAADECVDTLAAIQGIVTAKPDQDIVFGVAGDIVVFEIAGDIELRGSGQHQVFQLVCQGVIGNQLIELELDGVDAFPGNFGDGGFGQIVDDVTVVADTAAVSIDAFTAVENIIAVVTHQTIDEFVAGAGDIPCPGHAPLITSELKKINGVKDVKFSFPNLFEVKYNSLKTSKEEILSLKVFNTYKATVINEITSQTDNPQPLTNPEQPLDNSNGCRSCGGVAGGCGCGCGRR